MKQRVTFPSLFRKERKLLGMLIKHYRLEAGLSQEGLTHQMGKSHSYVSRLENGTSSADLIGLLYLLAVMKIDRKKFLCAFIDRFEVLERERSESKPLPPAPFS